jgi:hypothetical protein
MLLLPSWWLCSSNTIIPKAMAPCGMPRPCPWRAPRPHCWPQLSQRPPSGADESMDDGMRKPKGLWFIGLIWIYDLYRIIYELKLLGYHYMMGVQIVQTHEKWGDSPQSIVPTANGGWVEVFSACLMIFAP